DCQAAYDSLCTKPEIDESGRLGEETGAAAYALRPLAAGGFEHKPGSDGIPIPPAPLELESHGVMVEREVVTQQAQLRGVSVLQHDVQIAVLVKIKRRKCAAVLRKIQAGNGRHVGEPATPMIPVKHIALM